MNERSATTAAPAAAPSPPAPHERVELGPRPELDQLQAMGVVGMGGAGFPAHAKYRFAADTVVANGAECEPLLWSDKQLLLARADEVVAGLERAMALAEADRGILAIKEKYTEVVDAARSALRARGDPGPAIEIYLLENYYPAGDEVTLVQEVTGRTIPEAGLPLDVGVVVNNVATLAAMHRALSAGEPVTHRLVTVTGEVRRPGVLRAPIGAPLSALLEAAGGPTCEPMALVDGGPMMGQVVEDPEAPVGKTTSGLIVLPADHPLVRQKLEDPRAKLRVAQAACCLCAACTEVCPRNALGHRIWPDRLMRAVATGLTADTDAYLGALLCCECGLCTDFGCPLHLDPCRMNIEIKAQLRAEKVAFPDGGATEPSPFWSIKKVPIDRLVARIGVSRYFRHLERLTAPVECERVRLPLSQGVGQPARPVVRVGQRVAEGDLVAEPAGPISAALHASIPGEVEAVSDHHVVLRRNA